MEFNRNGIVVTVSDQANEQLVLSKLQGEPQPVISGGIPRIGTDDPELGGIVAGVMRGRENLFGGRDYLLIVGPEADGELQWQPASEWATTLTHQGFTDFTLPYRKEQALCFANVPELFKPVWYWSCEQHAGVSGDAWGQHFDFGGQGCWLKGDGYRARAVRRFSI